jgi:hypothetical protein
MTRTFFVGDFDLLGPPPHFRVNRPRLVELVDAGIHISVQAIMENSEEPAMRTWL